jgi:hypothetical protein
MGGWMLRDLGVGREGLRAMVHPALRDAVREIEPSDSSATSWASPSAYFGDQIGLTCVALRVRDSSGGIVGTLLIAKPNVGLNTIAMLTAAGDIEHFQRMHRLATANRRPAVEHWHPRTSSNASILPTPHFLVSTPSASRTRNSPT